MTALQRLQTFVVGTQNSGKRYQADTRPLGRQHLRCQLPKMRVPLGFLFSLHVR